MRSIINISLPDEMDRIVKQAVTKGNFATKSEFFRHLIREWMLSQTVKELEDSRKELKLGKGSILSSLRNLR